MEVKFLTYSKLINSMTVIHFLNSNEIRIRGATNMALIFLTFLLISSIYAHEEIFRDYVDYCKTEFCSEKNPICAIAFNEGSYRRRETRCCSPSDVAREWRVVYRFVQRKTYLALPFARTYKFAADVNTWVEFQNVWKRRGRALIISPAKNTMGHLFAITSIASNVMYLFKFKGHDGAKTMTTTTTSSKSFTYSYTYEESLT